MVAVLAPLPSAPWLNPDSSDPLYCTPNFTACSTGSPSIAKSSTCPSWLQQADWNTGLHATQCSTQITDKSVSWESALTRHHTAGWLKHTLHTAQCCTQITDRFMSQLTAAPAHYSSSWLTKTWSYTLLNGSTQIADRSVSGQIGVLAHHSSSRLTETQQFKLLGGSARTASNFALWHGGAPAAIFTSNTLASTVKGISLMITTIKRIC